MENQIVCPKCKKTIEISSSIRDEAKGAGVFSRSLTCDCGERISFWEITSQLHGHKKLIWKFQNWIRSLSHSQA
jgi:hypothetical protein